MRANDIVRIVAAHLDDGADVPMAIIPAAAPFFLVRLTTICVERRDLSVLREFILRTVQLGISAPSEIASMLGVRIEDISTEVDTLIEENFLSQASARRPLVLLEKGLAAISLTGLTRSVVRETGCYFDGVKRSVDGTLKDLLPKRRLPIDTLILPAVPARPPRIEEIDVVGVKAAILTAKNPLPRVLEVSRLGRIIRTNLLYANAFVLLKRGAHSVPLICVNGASDAELAQKLGGHPALQLVKNNIEKHERMVRRTLSQHFPVLRNIKPNRSSPLREALLKFVEYSDSMPEDIVAAERSFIKSSSNLFDSTHWVSAPEAQVLLAVALMTAKQHLTIIAPPLASALFSIEGFEEVRIALKRGIKVDLYISQHDERFSDHEDSLRHFLKEANFHEVQGSSGWCGFCVDHQSVLVAATKVPTSSSGGSDAFVGALVVGDDKGEQFLKDMALASGTPVLVKPKRKTFMK